MAAARQPRRALAARARSELWGGLSHGDVVLVDSAPLIYLLDGRAAFADRFAPLFAAAEQGWVQIAISTLTVAEVLAGPFKLGRDVLARRYETALSEFDVVPVSQEIAVMAARLRSRAGLRLPDALQAATALQIGPAALVTHDRDFSRLEGLPVLMGNG